MIKPLWAGALAPVVGHFVTVRDGPLENLWGTEGGRSTKKNIRAREN